MVIESVSTALAGNDFGLDDIQFTYSCTASASLNVQPYAKPEARALASDSLGCVGLCVNWADSSSIANGANIIWRQWTWGDGSQDTGRFPVHCYSDEGTYTGSLVVVSSQGCRDTVSLPPITIAAPPTLEVVFDSSATCAGMSVPGVSVGPAPVLYPTRQDPCYFYRINWALLAQVFRIPPGLRCSIRLAAQYSLLAHQRPTGNDVVFRKHPGAMGLTPHRNLLCARSSWRLHGFALLSLALRARSVLAERLHPQRRRHQRRLLAHL